MKHDKSKAQFCFLDLETTGLDPIKNLILEVAVVVTDMHLTMLGMFQSAVWNPGLQAHQCMPPNVLKMHRESGLMGHINDEMEKGQRIGLDDVQLALVKFLREYPPLIMTGFSVHFDKEFLRTHMPVVLGLFGHELMDVSAIKIGARFWRPDVPEYKNPNACKHRAGPDCIEAIEALKHYKRYLFTATETEADDVHPEQKLQEALAEMVAVEEETR